MPNSAAKVQKRIAKKKGKKANALHENSRDSQRLRRARLRDERLEQLANARSKGNQHHLDRIAFFQSAANARTTAFPLTEIQTLIEQYLRRDSEELATLKKERRPGRPSSTREDLLHRHQAMEEREYVSGFWLPDLEDQASLEALQRWSGDWSHLNTVEFVRIARSGVKRQSKFPPKGDS